MRLNRLKVGTYYKKVRGSNVIEFGWYESGRAFVAVNGLVQSYVDAYKEFVPKCSYNRYGSFYVGLDEYKKTIDGIVRYLINKHCKD